MKVVFLEDVEGVARGGDVKEVKNGFARNYLIPKNLAVPATHNALQRIEKLTEEAEGSRIKQRADMQSLGDELRDVRIEVEMRAGSGGRLYGSVTTAILAAKLSDVTGRQIDRRTIVMPDSLRELGMYTANIRLHPEIKVDIGVLVHPLGSDPEEYFVELQAAAEKAQSESSEKQESSEPDEELAVDETPEETVYETADATEEGIIDDKPEEVSDKTAPIGNVNVEDNEEDEIQS